MATLTVIRDSGYVDVLRAYQIVVDGEKVGEVRNGQTTQISVSAGRHLLSCRIDWCGSQTVPFEVADGGSVAFRVKSNLRGEKLLLAVWYAMFERDSYLTLEPDASSLTKQPPTLSTNF